MAGAPAEGLRRVAVAGGVAANSGLRRAITEACEGGACGSLPPLRLCTDNAGMVGLAAGFLPGVPWPDYLGLDAFAQRRRGQSGPAAAEGLRPPRPPRPEVRARRPAPALADPRVAARHPVCLNRPDRAGQERGRCGSARLEAV